MTFFLVVIGMFLPDTGHELSNTLDNTRRVGAVHDVLPVAMRNDEVSATQNGKVVG